MKTRLGMFGVAAFVSFLGTSALAGLPSVCKEPYEDLIEAVRALAQQKIHLATQFATPAEMLAEEESFLNCYREMLRNKADINYSDSTGFTPALAAAHFRLYSVLEFLEENGANIDIKDQSGYSARSVRELAKKK